MVTDVYNHNLANSQHQYQNICHFFLLILMFSFLSTLPSFQNLDFKITGQNCQQINISIISFADVQILVDILAVAAADCLALIKVEDPDAGTKKNGSDNKYLLIVEITTPCMKIKPNHSFWLFWINILTFLPVA